MKRDQKYFALFFIFSVLFGIGFSQTQNVPNGIQNPLGIVTQWLPVIGAAILLSVCFAAILYIIGKLLNDGSISGRGIHEFGQAIGTTVFVVLALGVLAMFGSFVANSGILNSGFSSDLQNICNTLSSSKLLILQAGAQAQTQNPTALSCGVVNGIGTDISSYLNYGLAATYVLDANLTNQAGANLDSLYTYEGFVGFLSTLKSDPGLCEPADINPALNCALNPFVKRIFSVDVASVPLAGYNLISIMTKPLELQAIFIFYMLLTQNVLLFLLMNIWPYLLGAGIVLRALPFTRGAGGLLMGITLTVVIIMPMLVMMEYGILGQGTKSIQLAGNSALIQGNVIYGLNDAPGYTLSVDWGDGTQTTSGQILTTGITSAALSHTYQSTNNCANQNSCNIAVTLTDNHGNTYSASLLGVLGASTPIERNVNPSFYLASPTVVGTTVYICPTGSLGICNIYDSLTPNFYVFPNIKSIINYNSCWPWQGNLAAEEASDSFKMATLGGLGVALSFGGFVAQVPDLTKIGITCSPPAAIGTTLQLMDIYGLMSVVGIVLPLLNILIVIAAVKNISFLFGGDTDIAGLGKLV